jgi:hypothetical protein
MLDDFGARLGRAWRETNEERTDRRTVIADLIDGQYSDPARVVAFNTAEGWSRDVSQELADVIERQCAADGFDVPPSLESFIERHLHTQEALALNFLAVAPPVTAKPRLSTLKTPLLPRENFF